MDYRMLGGSGCAVSSLCLGTMTFGVETDEAGAHQQLDRFIEAGGTMVDMADVYGDGRSEEIIGRWFASRPSDVTEPVVLATKGRMPVDDSPNGAGLSARLRVPKTYATWADVLHLAAGSVPRLVSGQVGGADLAEGAMILDLWA
jgi:aryl-alcohol dehydrogenase-like predicted oxidoreductase